MIAYTVQCTFVDPAVAEEWIVWLREKHLADVCEAGAIDAHVIVMDATDDAPDEMICEVRYHFVSREAFASYERDHAPRLRAEGLELFPLDRGLTYARSLGEVQATHSTRD